MVDLQAALVHALPYLGYVGTAIGGVFAYLRWQEAKRMKAALVNLTDEVRALQPEKAEEVANALRFEKVGDSVRFPLPRLKAPPDLRERVPEAINQLPDQEKLLITLHYYEGLSNREIGDVLGQSEAEVSQLHTKAILRLKSLTGVGDEIEWTSSTQD